MAKARCGSVRRVIRLATIDDVPALIGLVRDLAEYEREPEAAVATEDDFRAALFPATGDPKVFADVAEIDGEVVGMAMWFYTFSTWTGRHGIWLEDLFVQPAHRGSGLGKALLLGLAKRCVEQDLPRLEWTVLDWNEPAIGFYRSLGAVGMEEWTTQRVDGDVLQRLAAQAG